MASKETFNTSYDYTTLKALNPSDICSTETVLIRIRQKYDFGMTIESYQSIIWP
jgi:hypothetical protein